MEAIGNAPEVYKTHCTEVTSDKASELYTWLGSVPQPRQLLGSRLFQQFNEFSFTVENNSYELSFIIDRDSFDDDSQNAAQARIAEVAEVWANYKDALFGALVTAGATSTDTFTGSAFYGDSATIGDYTCDNNLTAAIVAAGAPTAAEILTTVNTALVQLWRMQTDKAQEGFNRGAMGNVRALCKPEYERAFVEALNSAQISSSSNPWGQGMLAGFDVLPDLAAATHAIYVNAVGGKRGAFYYQGRSPLEIVVLNGDNDVAENHGVKVLVYQRFRFAYGDHRRSIRHLLTTA
jgi:hypothetical protein